MSVATKLWWLGLVLGLGLLLAFGFYFRPQVNKSITTQVPPLIPPVDAVALAEGTFVNPGLQVQLFAIEPLVTQPIALATDHRGRVWVAECTSYPLFDGKHSDQVVILEDTNRDGVADKRTVFLSGLQRLTGIEIGFGGVWLCATPDLLFVPDQNGDDIPDGPAEKKLAGWDVQPELVHHHFGCLTWGVDGWLYGSVGTASHSNVGIPNCPDEDRVSMSGGIWRYHPISHKFERFAEGMVNPWGLDFDSEGRLFACNNVIEHLWHVVPGGRYRSWPSSQPSLFSFELISTCADHVHWEADHRFAQPTIGSKAQSQLAGGGGHSHAGLIVYQGASLPDSYAGNVFLGNLHGRRINRDKLSTAGSSVVASHEADIFQSGDPLFRGVDVEMDATGAVLIADWNETGECHNWDGKINVSTGRIYRISTEKKASSPIPDLNSLSDLDLAKLQSEPNVWFARHVRRILQARKAEREIQPAAVEVFVQQFTQTDDPKLRLRGLWALHAIGWINTQNILLLLNDSDEQVRGWGVTLACEALSLDETLLAQLQTMAEDDPAIVVRMKLACAIPRFPAAKQLAVGLALAKRAQDADDSLIPLLLWYALEPLIDSQSQDWRALLTTSQIPQLRRFTARKITQQVAAEAIGLDPLPLDELLDLAASESPEIQADIAEGIRDALWGLHLKAPANWSEFSAHLLPLHKQGLLQQQVLDQLLEVFLDEAGLAEARKTAVDPKQPLEHRRLALRQLQQHPDAATELILTALVEDENLSVDAILGLKFCSSDEIAPLLVELYPKFSPESRQATLEVLTSRSLYFSILLSAVESGQISAGDFSQPQVQALRSLADSETQPALASFFPESDETKTLRAELTRLEGLLTPSVISQASLKDGKRLFTQRCATCHVLFSEGRTVGPSLTGAQRKNLHYLLENILLPSLAVPLQYRSHVIVLSDGRVAQGIISYEDQRRVQIQTAQGTEMLDRTTIEAGRVSNLSLMPNGLLKGLSDAEIASLMQYLMSENSPPGVSAK